jgi:diaminopropionate ammonia-lyase
VARILLNPRARRRAWTTAELGGAPGREPSRLHAALPGYAPTPLREARHLASALGLARVWVKDESERLGLPAFKILGASWAAFRALARALGRDLDPAGGLAALREALGELRPWTLVAATDGNHGRGVARVARWLGLSARVFVPVGTAAARIDSIASEGAEVEVVLGSYDETVERAAREATGRASLIQDHAWPGYEEIPRQVAEGYATLFFEVEDALALRGATRLDAVLIQIGVGALAAAAVQHYRRAGAPGLPALIGVEPCRAACVLESLAADRRLSLPVGADASIMAGLNCGTPSSAAWPLLREGLDACVAVGDARAREAMRALAADGIVSGESGAAGAAGLLELCAAGDARAALGLGPQACVLLVSTEGATDPESYARIVA